MHTEAGVGQATTGSPSHLMAILGYHKVGEPPGEWWTWNYVPEATFADHLRSLNDSGWAVIDHTTFLLGLAAPETLPARAALITFDDGYRSFGETALPILRRFGLPAVLFVPTDYIGQTNRFDHDIEPEEAICGWADLKELERSGIAVQSHGVAHRRFSELQPRQRRHELVHSKQILETGLAKPVETFSFPYGDEGSDPCGIRLLLQDAGYQAAVLYGGGVNALPICDRYRLTRLAMGPDTDLLEVLGTE
jgi:peptidoglycan/xylan/chitin deacetylase (PgdA/CDA1 family)